MKLEIFEWHPIVDDLSKIIGRNPKDKPSFYDLQTWGYVQGLLYPSTYEGISFCIDMENPVSEIQRLDPIRLHVFKKDSKLLTIHI